MHRKSLDPGFHLFPGDSFRAKLELSITRVDWHGRFLPSQSTLHRQCSKPYHIARKFRRVNFRVFCGFVAAHENFNLQNYIYVVNNGNWIGICENKITKT